MKSLYRSMFKDFHFKLASVMGVLLLVELFLDLTNDQDFSFFFAGFTFGCIFIVIYSNSYINKSLDLLLSLPITRMDIFKFYIKWNLGNYFVYSLYFFVYLLFFKLIPDFFKSTSQTEVNEIKKVLPMAFDKGPEISMIYETELISLFFIVVLLMVVTVLGNPSHANQKIAFLQSDNLEKFDEKKVNRNIIRNGFLVLAAITYIIKSDFLSYNLFILLGILFFAYFVTIHVYSASFYLHNDIKKKIIKRTSFIPISLSAFLLFSLLSAQNSSDPNVRAYSKLDYSGLPYIGFSKNDYAKYLRDNNVNIELKHRMIKHLYKEKDRDIATCRHKLCPEKIGLSFKELAKSMEKAKDKKWINYIDVKNVDLGEFSIFLQLVEDYRAQNTATTSIKFSPIGKSTFIRFGELFARNDLKELMMAALSHKTDAGTLFFLQSAKFLEDEKIHKAIADNWEAFSRFPNSFTTLMLSQYGQVFTDKDSFMSSLADKNIGRSLSSQDIFCEQIYQNLEKFELKSTNPIDYQKLNQCFFKTAKPKNRGIYIEKNLYAYENRMNEHNPVAKKLGEIQLKNQVR